MILLCGYQHAQHLIRRLEREQTRQHELHYESLSGGVKRRSKLSGCSSS